MRKGGRETIMRKGSVLIAAVAALALLAAPPATAKRKKYSHQKYFEHYEGTKTCLKCHKNRAREFIHSQHYQWKAPATNVVGADGKAYGKINMINDYCTNPTVVWKHEYKNKDGKVVEEGCSKCHAGFGKLPSDKETKAEFENIDCLICHANGYRRGLYENEDGSLEWKPILWKNQVGLDSVSKRITKPTRTMCLRCHSGSGGGPNFKRGDLEYALTDCDSDFDVHMAKDGNDFQCIDCHAGEAHKIPGPGADIAGDEMPNKNIMCDNDDCHGSDPHGNEILDQHTKRVYCTVCHIPEFAKKDATNMTRDWSKGHYSEKKGKWTYTAEFKTNVTPAYTWWNGKTIQMQLPGEPVKKNDKGQIIMSVPVGSKDDPNSRIFAFKEYHAVMPVENGTERLLPIETGYFYITGDMDTAVRNAAKQFYGIDDVQYDWAPTIHYQGLFHEVQPAKNALGCLDCHGGNGRLDWKALGYDGDPLLAMMHAAH